MLTPAVRGQSPSEPQTPPREQTLTQRQATLQKGIAAFEQRMQRLAKLLAEDEPEKAEKLRSSLKETESKAQLAAALAKHLSANAFERWLLQEAFARLVEGASARLRDLSQGNYSFDVDEKLNFDVIDHHNADEKRSVRTLSGGEMFLASLALALSLADQIAQLAADNASRLDSIFLDEGFGTLDPDTLDTVAATIEELGSQGRTVGLVTHVSALAERIPVQYRVTKGPRTSIVEKVLQ